MKRKKVAAFVMAAVMVFQQTAVTTIAEEQTLDVNQAADMCMEENTAQACMEVSEQTENSEGQALSESAADESGQAESEIYQNTEYEEKAEENTADKGNQENSEGVTENDGQVASDGLADNAGENQWESPAEGSS